MGHIHTHYDNLKVTRNAPPEVIRAAYRSLSQKYHPDLQPDNPDEAERIMRIINASYEILSDPIKRHEHDQWIRDNESIKHDINEKNKANIASKSISYSYLKDILNRLFSHLLKNWLSYGFGVFIIWILIESSKPAIPSSGPKPYQDTPIVVEKPAYVRENIAPNGNPWPISAGYIDGYQRLNTGGLSTVTIDNSQNDSDVFVKLVSLDSEKAYPVRQFFIPALGRFTLKDITAGSYDIRYRDLNTGMLSRSESFNLEEISSTDGTQFTNYTMTLYKVQNGNLQTFDLSESEF